MILTNADKTFIFLHIYRTGGRSFREAVGGVGLIPLHPKMREVRSYMIENGEGDLFDNAFKCTLTRNPFDWQLSVFRYIKTITSHPQHQEVKDLSLFEYLTWLKNVAFIKYPDKFATQYDFLSDENGLLVDYCGKLETFDSSIVYVCGKLNILPPSQIPHIKDYPKSKSYTELYGSKEKKLIEEMFSIDLTTFGYDF